MRCYHRTSSEAAAAIVADGFRDAAGSYMTGNTYQGVWVSTEPLTVNEGASGAALLSTVIPEDVFAEYVRVSGPPACDDLAHGTTRRPSTRLSDDLRLRFRVGEAVRPR
jgi:hypothetical protein